MRSFHLVSTFTAAALFAASSIAGAQTTDPTLLASRRALIDRATAARTAGRHAEALDLAQRAAQIQMTPSLRLFVMQEQTQVGQLAEAYSSAIACQSEAARDTATSALTIARLCADSVNTLQGRVGRVVVTVTPAVDGVRVYVANRELHAALLGQEYVVTPGAISVRAELSGHRTASRDVTVVAGASMPVALVLEREAAPQQTVVTPPDTHGSESNTVSTPNNTDPATARPIETPAGGGAIGAGQGAGSSSAPRAGARPLNVGAIVTTATGGAILVGGSVLLGLGASATAEYDQLCTPRCTQNSVTMGRAAYERANTMFAAGIAGVAIGGAVAVGGLVWMLVARPRSAPTTTAWVTPTSGGAMIAVGGSL